MESKKVVPMWASIVLIVLCGVAFVLNIRSFVTGQTSGLGTITNIIELLSVFLAVCYCFAGYEKASAFLFKAVIFARIISIALAIVSMVLYGTSFAPAVVLLLLLGELISFGFLFVFGFALDIGKKRSVTMAVIALAVNVLLAIIFITAGGINSLGMALANVLFFVIFLIMMFAKYRDKASRGKA